MNYKEVTKRYNIHPDDVMLSETTVFSCILLYFSSPRGQAHPFTPVRSLSTKLHLILMAHPKDISLAVSNDVHFKNDPY